MKNALIALLCGLIFGTGLILSGMAFPQVIIDGLSFGLPNFTPNLIVTFATALITTSLIYALAFRQSRPWCAETRQLPLKEEIDKPLIIGAALFGIGWGIAGLCPGPNLVGLGFYNYPFYWCSLIGMAAGLFIGRTIMSRIDQGA